MVVISYSDYCFTYNKMNFQHYLNYRYNLSYAVTEKLIKILIKKKDPGKYELFHTP